MRMLLLFLVLTVGGCVHSHHGWHSYSHRHNQHTGDTKDVHAVSRIERRTLKDGPLTFQRVPLRRGAAR